MVPSLSGINCARASLCLTLYGNYVVRPPACQNSAMNSTFERLLYHAILQMQYVVQNKFIQLAGTVFATCAQARLLIACDASKIKSK